MNDNDTYIVQCTQDNFDDVRYQVQMFCRVIDIDHKSYCIKTCSLDSTMKKLLGEIGASFWPAPDYAVTKSVMGKRF